MDARVKPAHDEVRTTVARIRRAQARAPQPPQRATPRDGDGKPGGEGPPYADRLREVVHAEKSQAQPHKRGLRMREHRGRRLATDAGMDDRD